MSYYPAFKKALDIFLSGTAFLILSPLFYLIIIFIKLDSTGPVFFKQKRIGQHFKPFQLIKFRSMSIGRNKRQKEFEPGNTDRVTKVGVFLRKTKLDELPELLNVLNLDMSIVGPRPEVEEYVWANTEDFSEILKIRPGLSDFASIKYRDEESILAGHPDPEEHYCNVILPDKLRLARRYAEEISFSTDLSIIRDTLRSFVVRDIVSNG